MTARPLTPDEAAALRLIVARSADAFREASKTLAAGNVLPLRISSVADMALRDAGADWSLAERSQIAAIIPPSGEDNDTRDTYIRFRCTESEKARVEAAASAVGQSVSEYVRMKCGL